MLKMGKRKLTKVILSMLLIVAVNPNLVWAVSSSSNYSIEESAFSSGSNITQTSASYSGRASAGDLGIGFSESGNYLGFVGPISPDQEFVELNIPLTTVNMGVLNPGTAGTGTATFTARAYLDSSYLIITPRNPPSNGEGHEISSMTSATTFNSTLEQFGMNLVANTSPTAQGANPSRQPVDDGFFAFGEAAPGYNTADNYQYNAGDVIARSITRGHGETDYTISYMMNVTTVTPAGFYSMEQDLVILATF